MSAHTLGPLKERVHYTARSPRVDRIDLVDADGARVATVLADDTEQVENCTILEVVSRTGKANAAEIVRRWNAHKGLAMEMRKVETALSLVLREGHDDPPDVDDYTRRELIALLKDVRATLSNVTSDSNAAAKRSFDGAKGAGR